jgi:hypothetical protein
MRAPALLTRSAQAAVLSALRTATPRGAPQFRHLLRSLRPSSLDTAGNKSANGAMRALGKVVAERDIVSVGMAGRGGAEVWSEGGFSVDRRR